MSYFKDLTPYTYGSGHGPIGSLPALNIGWINNEEDNFPTKEPSPELVEKLWLLSKNLVNLYRGAHKCGICKATVNPYGNGEIRVTGEDGTIYAAPTLVVHYVEAHHYNPPDEFIKAVLNTPTGL